MSAVVVMVMMVSLAPLTLLIHAPGSVKNQEEENVGKRLIDHAKEDEATQTIADEFDGLIFIHWGI